MHEIRIDDLPRSRRGANTRDVERDIGRSGEEMGFEVRGIEDTSSQENSSAESSVAVPNEPGEMVRVKFEKFVQLVATHNFEEVLKHYPDEDIVMNSNLLMDLASAHEDTEDPKKQPLLIGFGVVIGVIIAYVLFKFF